MPHNKSTNDSLAAATEAAKQGKFEEAADLIEQVLAEDQDNLRALDLGGFVRFF